MVSCKRIPSSCIHFRLKFPACLLGACFFFSRFSRPRGWRWSTCLRSRGLHRCLGWVHPKSFGLKKIYRKFHVSFTLSTNSTDSAIHLKQASLLYYELDRAFHVCARYLKWIYPLRSQAFPGLMKPKQGPRRGNLPTRSSSSFSPYRISSNRRDYSCQLRCCNTTSGQIGKEPMWH